MTLRRFVSLTAIALLAGTAAQAQVSPSNPLPLAEVKAWDQQMHAYEKAGDKRLLQSLRTSTLMHVDLEPQPGARVSITLNGDRLVAYFAQSSAQRKQMSGSYKESETCNWYNDPKSGDAMETCTVTLTAKSTRVPPAPTLYSFSLVSKDSAGFYVREAWLSDKKMF